MKKYLVTKKSHLKRFQTKSGPFWRKPYYGSYSFSWSQHFLPFCSIICTSFLNTVSRITSVWLDLQKWLTPHFKAFVLYFQKIQTLVCSNELQNFMNLPNTRSREIPKPATTFIPVWGSNWGYSGFPVIKITMVRQDRRVPYITCIYCCLSVKMNMHKTLQIE